MTDEDEMFYAHPESVEGLLQRGRGLGAIRAAQDPQQAAPFVYDSIRRDWSGSFPDERAIYLARLIRDLRLSPTPVAEQLSGSSHEHARATDVLVVLALDGSNEARDALRAHIRDGAHWMYVLEEVAHHWPTPWWDDLGDIARTRIVDVLEPPLTNPAWIRFGIDISHPVPRPSRRDLSGHTIDALYGLLTETQQPKNRIRVDALRELRHRDALDALLPLVPTLVTPDDTRLLPEIYRAVEHLGPAAVPAAHAWAHHEFPRLAYLGATTLADQLVPEAIPLLIDRLAELRRTHTWCGPDAGARRLARFGSAATDALTHLRWFWLRTPHSYERAAYLQALAAIDRTGLDYAHTESLWDCEENSRLQAIDQAPDSPLTRARIADLRDDPMETPDVRSAAAGRAAGSQPFSRPGSGAPSRNA
ncbi:hypothetical protein [Streptomyces smaragdinus]|nr:hypothetical protein [Streptomyces smaragdinus]